MKKTSRIGNKWYKQFPDLDDISNYFLEYSEEKWSTGGASGGGFTIYGAEGTEDKEPYKKRIDIILNIYDHPDFGMFLNYRKYGGGYKEHYYSVGDRTKLSEFVANRHGDLLSVGLFIPPEKAWLAVKDFILENGLRSPQITWANDHDLPPEAFPPPE